MKKNETVVSKLQTHLTKDQLHKKLDDLNKNVINAQRELVECYIANSFVFNNTETNTSTSTIDTTDSLKNITKQRSSQLHTNEGDGDELWLSISKNIATLMTLRDANPSKFDAITEQVQHLVAEGKAVQSKSWADHVDQFQKTANAVKAAIKAAEKAIQDISKTADAIQKASIAIKWIVIILSLL